MTFSSLRSRRGGLQKPLELPPDQSLIQRRYALEHALDTHRVVYQAWDGQEGRQVLLKRSRDPHRVARLQEEVNVLHLLDHPAIPRVLDFFQDRYGYFTLIEEWRTGEPMCNQRWHSLAEVVEIGLALCDVLEYLHGQGIIHRDLKPENILVKPFSLLDFDIAGIADDDSDRRVGTQGYVAPEQWSQRLVHAPADIYSLGMVLGTSLTNTPPEEVRQVGSFSGLWPSLPAIPDEIRPLLDLFDRSIKTGPNQRPMLSEFRQVLSQQ